MTTGRGNETAKHGSRWSDGNFQKIRILYFALSLSSASSHLAFFLRSGSLSSCSGTVLLRHHHQSPPSKQRRAARQYSSQWHPLPKSPGPLWKATLMIMTFSLLTGASNGGSLCRPTATSAPCTRHPFFRIGDRSALRSASSRLRRARHAHGRLRPRWRLLGAD